MLKGSWSGPAKVEFLEEETADGLPPFILLEDLSFRYRSVVITVPKGTRGNGASIPRIYRISLSPVDPRILRASILHDYLYSGNCPLKFGRFKADALYFLGCYACGLSPFRCFLQFLVLRIFGRLSFKTKYN